MKPRLPITFLVSLIAAISGGELSVRAEQYVAYSLNTAKETLRANLKADWRETQSELYDLGGMTRVRGLVIDRTNNDVIVIGLRDKSRPALTLDDLSVALRARLVKGEWPLVSIDFTEQTKTTKMQKVRYEGGIEGTGFGSDMFDADLRLKKIYQGTLASGSPKSVFENSDLLKERAVLTVLF
jgi:hypothetical protein